MEPSDALARNKLNTGVDLTLGSHRPELFLDGDALLV